MAGTSVEAYGYHQMSASANICAGAAILGYVVCSSSTSGTIAIYDDAATGTTTKVLDTMALTAGQSVKIPFGVTNGIYVVIGGTASVTIAFVKTQ